MFQDLKNNSPHGEHAKQTPACNLGDACTPERMLSVSSRGLQRLPEGIRKRAVGAEQPLFILYDGLLAPNEIYDADSATALEGILLFGDDMRGYCAGFDTDNAWQVVEIDPLDGQAHVVAASFQEYLRDLLN
nr:SMI1/KNR4 family protein [Pseudomonas sp. BIGb0427]